MLGAGSWGTALAVQLARAGFEVPLWARRAEFAERLREERVNDEYLPDIELPESLRPTADLERLGGCDALLVVVPSHGLRAVVRSLFEVWPKERACRLVSGIKGVEIESLERMSGVAESEAEAAGVELRYAVLSGPTFAAELARGVPSAAVVASTDAQMAAEMRDAFAGPSLRLYSSTDVVGVELGGAAKNVIAVAGGVVAGVGLGHNTLAALITRGLHELTRLGIACGGRPRTFSGLAGLGDLVLTCTGGLSRNRRAGLELAAGKTLDEIERGSAMVAEGIRNSLAITRLARREGVEMPICEQMKRVIYEGQEPRAAVEELMTREQKAESEL